MVVVVGVRDREKEHVMGAWRKRERKKEREN